MGASVEERWQPGGGRKKKRVENSVSDDAKDWDTHLHREEEGWPCCFPVLMVDQALLEVHSGYIRGYFQRSFCVCRVKRPNLVVIPQVVSALF